MVRVIITKEVIITRAAIRSHMVEADTPRMDTDLSTVLMALTMGAPAVDCLANWKMLPAASLERNK